MGIAAGVSPDFPEINRGPIHHVKVSQIIPTPRSSRGVWRFRGA